MPSYEYSVYNRRKQTELKKKAEAEAKRQAAINAKRRKPQKFNPEWLGRAYHALDHLVVLRKHVQDDTEESAMLDRAIDQLRGFASIAPTSKYWNRTNKQAHELFNEVTSLVLWTLKLKSKRG